MVPHSHLVEERLMGQKDWQGHDVPADEAPETEIKWWVVTNLTGSEHDETWVRGWQDMLSYVSDHLDEFLEHLEADELIESPAKISFTLRSGTRQQYDEVANSDY